MLSQERYDRLPSETVPLYFEPYKAGYPEDNDPSEPYEGAYVVSERKPRYERRTDQRFQGNEDGNSFNEIVDSILDPAPRNKGSRKSKWRSFEHFYSEQTLPKYPYTIPVESYESFWIYRAPLAHICSLYAQFRDTGVNAFPYGDAGMLDNNLPVWNDLEVQKGFVPEPDALEILVNRSLRNMLPSIRAELSLINSLIEIREIGSLRHTVKTIIKTLKALRLRGSNARNTVRTAADIFLQWKFNLAPLISDIKSIYDALISVQERVIRLLNGAGKVQTRHFTFNWQEYENVVEPESDPYYGWDLGTFESPSPNGFPSQFWVSRRVVQYSPSRFHAQIQFNYNYTELQTVHAQLYGLLDSLGVNFDPSIIWNAVPWSFVVDWVIRIGEFLDRFKVELMKPQINILRYLWSVRRERRIQVHRRLSSNEGDSAPRYYTDKPAGYAYPQVRQTAYRRSVGMLSKNSLLVSGLNSNEFTIAAALVATQQRKPRRQRRR